MAWSEHFSTAASLEVAMSSSLTAEALLGDSAVSSCCSALSLISFTLISSVGFFSICLYLNNEGFASSVSISYSNTFCGVVEPRDSTPLPSVVVAAKGFAAASTEAFSLRRSMGLKSPS